ncbi:OTU domain-containing protein 4-like isoform X1 [Salarias fasciatus]|nr:OTU domain-containing protein 4-like isoform X1 [Salarias fasciatus]
MEGGVRSGDERGAEKLMDEYLKSIGLVRKKVAKDGSCLFRAVAEQVLHCQNLHTEIRAKCVDFLKQNRSDYEAFIEGDFGDYLFKLRDPQQWVGEVEIHALSIMYKRDFLIFQEPGKPAVSITDNNFKDKVQLCFLNGNHYDSVYPESHIKNAALCQSILYELLYEGVFKVDRNLLAACQRPGRPTGVLIDDGLAACRSSDDSDGDVDEPPGVENGTSSMPPKPNSYRGRGRGRHLPERVRRSLNPTLLRNVEYDVWQKSKRAQQKMDYCIAAGMHFSVGDRCQVRLESNGRSYSATVKEVPPKNGLMSVYIEELGMKHVPLWSIQPAREDGGWSTVVSRDRKLNNGDWEEKGRGRGRGRSTPASSSGTQGSGGRVQKQHSWHAQSSVDEHGKSGRKSLSLVEEAFGLTEELLKAREEEELNVALVEIQLRDELSFPALGKQNSASTEGGKKKSGERRNQPQRNKTKSPVEDVRPPSPSSRERPRSSTPPAPGANAPAAKASNPARTAPAPVAPAPVAPATVAPATVAPATVAPATVAPAPVAPAPVAPAPVAPAPVAPTRSKPPAAELTFLGDSMLDVTTATASARAPKAGAQSYSSAVAPATPPPFAPLPPAAPPSMFSFLTPVLPPACTPPPASPPTFIAPIAPSPTGFPRPSASPPTAPSPPLARPVGLFQDPTAATLKSMPKAGSALLQNQIQNSAPPAETQTQVSGAQIQSQSPAPAPKHQDVISQSPALQVQNQETMPSKPQIQNQSMQNHRSIPSKPQIQNPEIMPPRPQNMQSQETMPPRPQIQNMPNQETVPSRSHIQNPEIVPSRPQIQNLQNQEAIPSRSQIQSSAMQDPNLMPSGSQIQTLNPEAPLQYPDKMFPVAPIHFQSAGLQNPETRTPPAEIQTQSSALQDQDTIPPRPHIQSQGPGLAPQVQDMMQGEAPPPPGPAPLLQLPQVYQDLLYNRLPQGDKDDVAPTLPYSTNKSGDDLPRDMNVLRFFFNLGVKAYSMPMCFPYMYILPLMQTHFLQPPSPPRSPSPVNPPTRHPEPPPPPPQQYSQPGYGAPVAPPPPPPPQQMPWQQLPPPRNPPYPSRFPPPPPVYPIPPSSQGYHQGQFPGHPVYPPVMPQYPPPSLGYPPQHVPEDLQGRQGAMEPRLPPNGNPMPGLGPVPGPSLLGVPPPAATMANANSDRAVMVAPGFGGREPGDGVTRPMMLMDPPLSNRSLVTLVSDADRKDVAVSVGRSSPGSSSPFRGLGMPLYIPQGAPPPPPHPTDDSWEEAAHSHRGGGRGRGYRGSRRPRGRRYPGELGAGLTYTQFTPSHRGRGHDRAY